MNTLGKLSALLLATAASLTAGAAETALEPMPSRPGLVIQADFLVANLRSNTVFYSNNVVVVDPPAKPGEPETTLRCRELTATRGSNGIQTIEAVGFVEIDQGDLHARSDRAVYTHATEQFVMTEGNARFPLPTLYSLHGSITGTNTGTAIVYDRRNDRLFIKTPRTELPGTTLQGSGTNSPASTNRSGRPAKLVPGL